MKKGLLFLITGIVLVLIGAWLRLTHPESALDSLFMGAGLILELVFAIYLIQFLRKK